MRYLPNSRRQTDIFLFRQSANELPCFYLMLFSKVYFWTSSPALPASEEGFQPKPSVTVKPAHDHQLPTANTCISRLYIPLYSSRAILKSKLLLAIKAKTFGFV